MSTPAGGREGLPSSSPAGARVLSLEEVGRRLGGGELAVERLPCGTERELADFAELALRRIAETDRSRHLKREIYFREQADPLTQALLARREEAAEAEDIGRRYKRATAVLDGILKSREELKKAAARGGYHAWSGVVEKKLEANRVSQVMVDSEGAREE